MSANHVMFICIFCLHHQLHLIVGALLKCLDDWRWGPPHCHRRQYWSGVATIANVWRSTGTSGRIKRAAAVKWTDFVAGKYFNRPPCKPLRNRWGSIHAVEGHLIEPENRLGALFGEVFAQEMHNALAKAKAKGKAKGKANGKAKGKARGKAKAAAAAGEDSEHELDDAGGDEAWPDPDGKFWDNQKAYRQFITFILRICVLQT